MAILFQTAKFKSANTRFGGKPPNLMTANISGCTVYDFLQGNGYTKNQKRCLRRKAQANFTCRNGILYFSKQPTSNGSQEAREWKQVPRSLKDKERILKSCHDNNAEGKITSYHIII